MEINYFISYKLIQSKLIDTILWELRQFGITSTTDSQQNNKTLILYQGEKFEINHSKNLPFKGNYISIKGPKLQGTSYIRKGLIELVGLILISKFKLDKNETIILNQNEFDILNKNFSLDVISMKLLQANKARSYISMDLIAHEKVESEFERFTINKYSIDKSKINDQIYALNCFNQKGEIEYHNSTFLKLTLKDYNQDVNKIGQIIQEIEFKSTFLNQVTENSKILRIRYNYDNLSGLYFLNNEENFTLIEFYQLIGQ